jgi:hypothetical protein
MSALTSLPAELHIEILVWSVVDHFNSVLDSDNVVDSLMDDLLDHVHRLTDPRLQDQIGDWIFPHDEDIERMAVAFFITAKINITPYLATSDTACLLWHSHHQVILRRAAAECRKILAFRMKAYRRTIARTRFQHVVFKLINPDIEIWDVPEKAPAKDTWYSYRLSTMHFWHLKAKDLALRRILSDQILMDKLIQNWVKMIMAVVETRAALGYHSMVTTARAAYRAFSSC